MLLHRIGSWGEQTWLVRLGADERGAWFGLRGERALIKPGRARRRADASLGFSAARG